LNLPLLAFLMASAVALYSARYGSSWLLFKVMMRRVDGLRVMMVVV